MHQVGGKARTIQGTGIGPKKAPRGLSSSAMPCFISGKESGMGAKSSIEWTDASWTPIRARVKEDAADIARARGYASLVQILEARKPNGELRVPPGKIGPHCEHCSPGCENCYSETNNGRCLPANGTGLPFDRRVRDLVDLFLDETILVQPLHWKRPRRIFVCSQTDLFGDFVADEMIDRVCAVMALCPQHTLQVLTKRAERMWEYFWSPDVRYRIAATAEVLGRRLVPRWANHVWKSPSSIWPMYNVWLGVSVEDVERKARMRFLRSTPAAVRFVSFEPLIEELGELELRGIDLAIWGGESGP